MHGPVRERIAALGAGPHPSGQESNGQPGRNPGWYGVGQDLPTRLYGAAMPYMSFLAPQTPTTARETAAVPAWR